MAKQARNFLRASDLDNSEIIHLFQQTALIKAQRRDPAWRATLHGKTLALYMEKPSVRTRVSFTVGIRELGGDVVELGGTQTKVGKGEHPYDFGAVIARYCDGLIARVYSDEALAEMAAGSKIPVINALSDMHHPCQALTDYFTMYECFGSLSGMVLAYIGDGNNNVTHSLLEMGHTLGIEVKIASPQGYEPDKAIAGNAWVGTDPREAVQGAHVVYTDTWTSMGRESEQQERRKALENYRVTPELLQLADPKVRIMHCLPAVRGEEITAELMHGPSSLIFDEAENRLHAQKALLAWLFSS
jgi:ornithine carbamoyltransferase